MIDNDIIENTNSQFSNPLVYVIKEDTSIRIYLTARQVNQIIIPGRQAPEQIDDILQRFEGVKYISSIDLVSGFWQIELDEESRKYVAFLFNGRNLQFKILPFGLNVSTSMFKKGLSMISGPKVMAFTTVDVGGVCITSRSFSKNIEHTRKCFERLREYSATI